MKDESCKSEINLNVHEIGRYKEVYESDGGIIVITDKGKTELVEFYESAKSNKSKIEKILGIKIEDIKN